MMNTPPADLPRATAHPTQLAGKAPQRQIRVHDDPFYRAVARTKEDRTSIGAVTTELLRRYADGEIDV